MCRVKFDLNLLLFVINIQVDSTFKFDSPPGVDYQFGQAKIAVPSIRNRNRIWRIFLKLHEKKTFLDYIL